MKFWKALKSSGGIWTNLPPNEAGENKDSPAIKDRKIIANQKHLEHNRKGNNSQLHRVSNTDDIKLLF